MSGQQLPIPGTEPTPRDLVNARHRLRRDHIRHRLNNLSARLMSLGSRTHALSDNEVTDLERMCTTIETAIDQNGYGA